MSLLSRIRSAFSRVFGGGGGSSAGRSSSSRATRRSAPTNYYRSSRGGSAYGGSNAGYEDPKVTAARKARERQKNTVKALASLSKQKSSIERQYSPRGNEGNGFNLAVKKLGEKATPPDPKQKAKEFSQARATKLLKSIDNKAKGAERTLNSLDKKLVAKAQSERDSFNKATGNKYNANTGDKAHDARARQRIKSGEYQSDPNAEKWEVKHHPIASSASRGALSGATFGVSELVANKSKKRQETGTEQYYQENKNKTAEFVGEMAGALAGFGMTADGATKLAGKVAPKFLKTGGANAAKALAENSAFRALARKEAERAGIKITDEVIERFALQRAQRLVDAVGTDMAINWTTGGLMDVTTSLRNTYNENNGDFDLGDFAKNYAVNRAINYGLGGAITVLPALRTSKGLLRRGARDDAVELAGRIAEESRMRQAMTDTFARDGDDAVRRFDMNDLLAQNSPFRQVDEAVRPQNLDEAVEKAAVETVEGNAGNVARAVEPQTLDEAVEKAAVEAVDSDAGNVAKAVEPASIREEVAPPAPSTKRTVAKKARTKAEREKAKAKLDKLLTKAERLQDAHAKGEEGALRQLVDTEDEIKAAFRESGMSRSDAYRESKKLFEAHKKELRELERKSKPKIEPKKNEPVLSEAEQAWEARKSEIQSELSSLRAQRQQLEVRDMTDSSEYMDVSARIGELERELRREGEPPKFVERDEAKALSEEAKAPSEKFDSKEHYKQKTAKDIEAAKAEPAHTETIGGKEFSAVDESPFDNANRVKPKFVSNEELAAKETNAAKKQAQEKLKTTSRKLKEQKNKFDKQKLPEGERILKKQKKAVLGEVPEETIKPASFEDVYEGMKRYAKGQASDSKEVVSRAGVSLMNATTNDAQRAYLKGGWKNGDFNYIRVKNHEKVAEAISRFAKDPDLVSRELIGYANDMDTLPVSKMVDTHYQAHCVMNMLRTELDNPALSEQEKAAVHEVYDAAARLTQRLSSISGQTNQFQGVMVSCSPKARAENAVDNIVDILDSSRGFRSHTRVEEAGETVKLSANKAKRRQQIRYIVLDNKDIKDSLKKVFEATNEEEYGDAMQELMLNAYKLNRASGFDYLQQWRYLAMLGNPKTHLRNMIGNLTFGSVRKISNATRGFLESGLEGWATKHGLEMQMHGVLTPKAWAQAQSEKLVFDDAGKSAWAAFKKHEKEILGAQKYDSPKMAEFFNALSELNSKALAKEDDFFRGRAYREQYITAYNKYLKKNVPITEEIEKRIHEEALRESQVATFNEFNELAQLLANSQRPLYDANASVGKKIGAGVSNALMPFTKVPANILGQSINYSPAGLAKGYAHIIDAARSGDSALLNKAIDELASGLTGTGIATAGYFLGKNTDLFTTNAGRDDAAAKAKKNAGIQNYSVLVKGKDGKTYSLTLDWMVPISSTFFTGVETANQFKNGLGGANLGEALGNISQISSRVIDPVLETSMLSGIYNIVENARKSSSYDDQKSFMDIVLRELVQSYLSSYVPTFQGQIARTAYKADKFVAGDDDWEYWFNSLKVKMGLANTNILTDALGDDVNAYGEVKNEKKTSSDYVKSFVKNAVLPTNIQEVTLTDTEKQKIKEYEDYVASGGDPADKEYLFPKKQYNKQFKYGKEGADQVTVNLTNKQVSLYNKAKTTGGAEGMRVVLEGAMFNRYDKDSDGKRTVLKNGYTAEEKQALIKQFEGKSMREVEEWLYKQPQFKSASEAEKRKVLNALWSYSQNGKSKGSKLVGEQAVIKDQGGDINEYNFKNEITKKKQVALQPYIDSGLLTYEQCVDFARYAGKTYYYDNDEGGSANTYYNKKQMLEYLESKGYTEEQAAALFNAFKQSNAKEYGSSSGKKRYRRRSRRRGYRSYGGSSAKATVPKPKTIKATSFAQGEALVSKSKSSSSKKATPPQLKRVQAKIDLPTKR